MQIVSQDEHNKYYDISFKSIKPGSYFSINSLTMQKSHNRFTVVYLCINNRGDELDVIIFDYNNNTKRLLEMLVPVASVYKYNSHDSLTVMHDPPSADESNEIRIAQMLHIYRTNLKIDKLEKGTSCITYYDQSDDKCKHEIGPEEHIEQLIKKNPRCFVSRYHD